MKSIDLFTPKALAAELGIPYRLVLTAIRTGKLRVIEFSSRHRRIRSEDAARWIASITR